VEFRRGAALASLRSERRFLVMALHALFQLMRGGVTLKADGEKAESLSCFLD